jgi:hypothetical protein
MADGQGRRLLEAAWRPLLVLAAIVGVLLFKAAEERPERAVPAAPITAPGGADLGTRGTVGLAPVVVYDYLEFAGLIGADGERTTAPADEYTARGLNLLADALAAVAAEHPGRMHAAAAAELRVFADQLQDDERAPDHARIARSAFREAAAAIEALSSRQGAQLHALADAVAADEPLRDQRDAVHAFFLHSADVLGTIGESRAPTSRPEA